MTGETLKFWLMIAWLLPLAGFVVQMAIGMTSQKPAIRKLAGYVAIACIAGSFVCTVIAFTEWGTSSNWSIWQDSAEIDSAATNSESKTVWSGQIYEVAAFGQYRLTIDYYIDSLTMSMLLMVTFVATCVHVFAFSYMQDELTEKYVDHEVVTSRGEHVHRTGRFHRFFAFLSLFSFSMLGLILAGNLFQVFVFWELVGICSYLLIGFYFERKTASVAAAKAFIMNRIGDFGFLIGLMILWTYCGTLQFGTDDAIAPQSSGLFQIFERTDSGHFATANDGTNVALQKVTGQGVEPNSSVQLLGDKTAGVQTADHSTGNSIPYLLLVLAGLGIFAGCVGKSAQFPLQTWLPDAMEGPTPVSALVHSATMVAAGVYLAGRCYPLFTTEVLLVIAYAGCITLLVGASIAVVATDIKKVLAYSTISQLGYMMLALGVFGWGAALFHLLTHAFFKSLLFLGSGSVIHGCHHQQQMTSMGGLLKKMPITAFTMLIAVFAISGFPTFSGYHSKDAIMASSLAFVSANSGHFLLFLIPLLTAGLTAFYMFRLWLMTFWGTPKDATVYKAAHESPLVMTAPLVVLAGFAWFCAVGGESGWLYLLLTGDQPLWMAAGVASADATALPSAAAVEAVHGTAGWWALAMVAVGTGSAWKMYGHDSGDVEVASPSAVQAFLNHKWYFDEIYDSVFVQPMHQIGIFCRWIDRHVIDGIVHGLSAFTIKIAKWDRWVDEIFVDGFVNRIGGLTHRSGTALKAIQTGKLRQYVTLIIVGVVLLSVLAFLTFPHS
ncbi:MAG: NADH-quinone oxidoreductase subunit L [Fuerstiella sp.]